MLDARTAFCFVSMHNNNLEGVQCISRVSFFVNDMPTSASVVMYVKSQLVSSSAFLEAFFFLLQRRLKAELTFLESENSSFISYDCFPMLHSLSVL